MADFQAAQGLVQLLFANEDTYITDGLVRLPLERYLYMRLKKAGYDKVLFFSDVNEPIYRFLDVRSKNAYVEYRNHNKTAIFQSDANDEIEQYNWCFVKRFKKTEGMMALNRVLDMLECYTNMAVVLPVEWFSRFSNEETMKASLLKMNQNNYKRNNLLLVHFPVMAESSRAYFGSPDSIFRSALFPELAAAFRRSDKVFLCDALKQEMGERVTFLNELNYHELKNLVQYIYLNHVAAEERFDIDKMVAFIWGWYHSDRLRFETEDVLPANEQRRMNVIYHALKERRTRDKLCRVIAELEATRGDGNKGIREIIASIGINKEERLLWENNAYYTKLNKAYEMVYKSCRVMGYTLLKRLEEIVNTMKSPCFPKSASLLDITTPMQYLTKACDTSDEVLMNKTVQALKYAVCDCNGAGVRPEDKQQVREREQTCWELYITSLKLADELHNVNANMKEFSAAIDVLERQLAEARNEVNIYLEENPKVLAETGSATKGNISAEYHILATKKSKVTGLYNNLVMNKNCLAQNLGLAASYQDYLQKIEMQIHELQICVNKELAKDIMMARDLMGEIWMDQQKQLKELKDLGQGFSLSLDEQGDMFRDNEMNCLEFEKKLSMDDMSEADRQREMYNLLNSL